MKKTAIIISGLLISFLVNAQDTSRSDNQVLRNKKGHEILPKKGDIALGFNTIPVLNIILDIFKPNSTNSPGAGSLLQYSSNSNNQIVGKYFLDAKTAIRVRFGLNTLAGSITNQVQEARVWHAATLGTADDRENASLIRAEDKLSFSKNNIIFTVGYEKRRGYRRLQGVYGVEIGVGNESASSSITYGNAFSDRFDVFYTDFSGAITTVTLSPVAPGKTTRDLETSYRGGFRFGFRGFVGIEYFIFSKISIAAEYGWGYSVVTRRGATTTREVYNNGENGPTVFTEDVNTDTKEATRGFSVDNNNGSVFSLNNTVGGNTALSGGAGALTLIFHF